MQKKTDKFIEKLVKKNYNNELEEILEKKNFDANTKSILLNILYKIETAYKDYEKVKQEVESKEEYIETFIKEIKDNCENIKVVKLNSEESRILGNKTFLVEKQSKRIICYPIERKLLYCIAKISKKTIIKNKYFLIDKTLSELINVGNNINTVEPMRDFNGYSWTTLSKEIESISHNLVYQNLRMLVGYKFLNNWVKNSEFIIDYMELFKNKLDEKYGEKTEIEFTNILENLSIVLAIKYNPKIKDEMKKNKLEIDEKLEKLQDNKQFVESLTKDKRKITKEIKKIDETLNNKSMLQEEYEKRNENLPIEKKIFSMRILSKMLTEERDEKIKKIEEINELLKPKKFINYKKQLEDKKDKLDFINVKNIEKEIEKYQIKLQKVFMQCFEKRIDKVETKQEIIKLIYELRYYCLLPFNQELSIYQVKDLRKEIEELQRKIIKKAHDLKAIDIFSKDEEIDYQILKEIFILRVISLEDLNVKIIKEKEKYYMQLFDEKVFEEKVSIENINKKDLRIKIGKRVKIFN